VHVGTNGNVPYLRGCNYHVFVHSRTRVDHGKVLDNPVLFGSLGVPKDQGLDRGSGCGDGGGYLHANKIVKGLL